MTACLNDKSETHDDKAPGTLRPQLQAAVETMQV